MLIKGLEKREFDFRKAIQVAIARAYNEGEDIKVVMNGVKQDERWFSRHIHKGESFPQGAERVFNQLAEEMGTAILPIV